MQFQEFNEKCDVYSYGIVLWEIITRDEPFAEYNSFDKFKEAVCNRHERPKIPEELVPGSSVKTPSSVKTLLQSLWHRDQTQRPSFTSILVSLNEVILDYAIRDPAGKSFWKENWVSKKDSSITFEVPWEEFKNAFVKFVGLQDSHPLKLLYIRCLQAVLPEFSKDKSETVSLERFGQVLDWFGTLEDSKDNNNSASLDTTTSTTTVTTGIPKVVYDAAPPTTNTVTHTTTTITTTGTPSVSGFAATFPKVHLAKYGTFFERLRSTLAKQWFHGDISAQDSEVTFLFVYLYLDEIEHAPCWQLFGTI